MSGVGIGVEGVQLPCLYRRIEGDDVGWGCLMEQRKGGLAEVHLALVWCALVTRRDVLHPVCQSVELINNTLY